MGLSPFRSGAKAAVAGLLAPLEMVGRFIDYAKAMPRAACRGDAAQSEDRAARGRKIHGSLFELRQAWGTGRVQICMCSRWIGSRWEHGNVLFGGDKGSF